MDAPDIPNERKDGRMPETSPSTGEQQMAKYPGDSQCNSDWCRGGRVANYWSDSRRVQDQI